MSVVSSRPRSFSVERMRPRSSSALWIAASDVGPLMPGTMRVEAVALIVLAAVRIARPEHQHEWLVAILEHRQHDFRGHGREIVLLRDIGGERSRRCHVARLAVVAARRAPSAAGSLPEVPASRRLIAECPSAYRSHHRQEWSAGRCVRSGRRSMPARFCRSTPCCSPCRGQASGLSPHRGNCRRNVRRRRRVRRRFQETA